jgi:hypothetical protein
MREDAARGVLGRVVVAVGQGGHAGLGRRHEPGVGAVCLCRSGGRGHGSRPAGDAETVAGRFVSWLAETSRPWLVVLDDLSDTADLEGLRPEGPAGRVLITTSNPAAVPGPQRALILSVGAFSPREALSYLMGRAKQ